MVGKKSRTIFASLIRGGQKSQNDAIFKYGVYPPSLYNTRPHAVYD